MRINIRLISISQFFKQFRLNIKYKFNKKYIVFDTLLRLINIKSTFFKNHSKFDVLYDYII